MFGFRGNFNIKKKDVKFEWTPELIEEFKKCATDPIYFAENYVKIVHPDRGFITIDFYDFQRDIIRAFNRSNSVAVATSRQVGKTTTATAIILHYVLFNEHKRVAILANKADTAREILARIKLAYEALPKWLSQGVVEWNKGSVEFENGCKIVASASSSSSIRGTTVNLLYIDECAFIPKWEDFKASVLPTISSGTTTKILYTSTPNGLNHYYSICEYAKKKGTEEWNGFEYIEVPWWLVPGRDEKWKKRVLGDLNGDMQKFAQEYEVAWLGSSGTLIDGATLKSLIARPPVNIGGGLKIYEEPDKEKKYMAIVDVSRGKGLDYSAVQVIDVNEIPYKQVAVFRNNETPPIEFAGIIHGLVEKYNKAPVLVEINDIGEQVADLLHYDFEYDNILYTESNGRAGINISLYNGSKSNRGIRTTKTVKAVGCSMLKLLVEQNRLQINDFDTIHELSTFSKKGTSYEAEEGCHDDLAMTLVLFGWLSGQKYFKEITDIHTLAELRTRTDEELEREVPFFGCVDSIEENEKGPALEKTEKDFGWELVDTYPLEYFKEFDPF